MKRPPIILCIGGLDPTGGAGIQADIETVTALGARALTLITALTAQDTRDVVRILPTPVEFFASQADTLLRDIRPDAIKVGLLGSTALVPEISSVLAAFRGPVVIDPVLAAGGGFDLEGAGLVDAVWARLVPRAALLTPNRAEARRLSGCDDPTEAAQAMLCQGAGGVLLTAADEAEGDQVRNLLFSRDAAPRPFSWPRLAHHYHGSGCTLASACATRLAMGDDLVAAAAAAQAFTWKALESADRVGGGQRLPRRRA
jgi:hydroxymethylpyrimidine/phosphomethylpyrimidine kinase